MTNKEISKTISYYNENASDFVANTINADMSSIYKIFLAELATNIQASHILDFGCGSGRDSLYFKKLGATIEALDGSAEICAAASTLLNTQVICQDFLEYRASKQFDAIWACASLLHLNQPQLLDVLKQLALSLRLNGILYVSFKYGHTTAIREGRLFTDMDEDNLIKLVANEPKLKISRLWQSQDVRADKNSTLWLNAIIRKIEND